MNRKSRDDCDELEHVYIVPDWAGLGHQTNYTIHMALLGNTMGGVS